MRKMEKAEVLKLIARLAWSCQDYEDFWQQVNDALSRSRCRRFMPRDVLSVIEREWAKRESLLG